MQGDDGYQVFVSFRNLPDDLKMARDVVKALRKRGFTVFFSEKSIGEEGRSDWRSSIDRALQHASVMVVVASLADHLESGWVFHEWQTFSTEIVSGRKSEGQIYSYCESIPVERLPLLLRQRQAYKAGRQGLEGLADAVGSALLRQRAAGLVRTSTGRLILAESAVGLSGAPGNHPTELNPYLAAESDHVTKVKPGGVTPLALLDLSPRFELTSVCAVPDSRFDFEIAAFLLQHSHVVDSERDVVYFNGRQHFSGALSLEVRSSETPFVQRLSIDLGQVPSYVHRIAVVAFLYESVQPVVNFANSQGVSFWIGSPSPAAPRLALDPGSRFKLESTGVRLVDFFRAPTDLRSWSVQARCAPMPDGFAGACEIFEVP